MPTKEELLAQLPDEVKNDPKNLEDHHHKATYEERLDDRIYEWAVKQGYDMRGIYPIADVPSWATSPTASELEKTLGVMYAAQQAKQMGKQVAHAMDFKDVQSVEAGFHTEEEMINMVPGLKEKVDQTGKMGKGRTAALHIREYAKSIGLDLTDEANLVPADQLPKWAKGQGLEELGQLAVFIQKQEKEKQVGAPELQEMTGMTVHGIKTVPVREVAAGMGTATKQVQQAMASSSSPYSKPQPEPTVQQQMASSSSPYSKPQPEPTVQQQMASSSSPYSKPQPVPPPPPTLPPEAAKLQPDAEKLMSQKGKVVPPPTLPPEAAKLQPDAEKMMEKQKAASQQVPPPPAAPTTPKTDAPKPTEPSTPKPTDTAAPPPPPAPEEKKSTTPQPEKPAFEVFKALNPEDKKNILYGLVAQEQALIAASRAYGSGGKAYQAINPGRKGGLYRNAFMSRVNGALDDPDKAVIDDKVSQGYTKYLTDYIRTCDQQLTDIQLVKDGSMSQKEYWEKYRGPDNWNRPLEADIALVQQARSKAVAVAGNLHGVAINGKMPANEMQTVIDRQASLNIPFQHVRKQAEAYKKGVTERFEKNVTANYEKNYLLAQQRAAQVVAGRMGDLTEGMDSRLEEMAAQRAKSKKPNEKTPQEESLEKLNKCTKAFRELAATDTSKMSKEDLVKHDFALSQATMAMEKSAQDYIRVAGGKKVRGKQDPTVDMARQIAAAAQYTSSISKTNRAQLRANYGADRRRMEQAVAQRTHDMQMEYMRQAGMLQAPQQMQQSQQQMKQAPQQVQAQYMQAQSAYQQTAVQYQTAQANMQSLQMQMLQAQRNLAAAEMARYQARMAYLDVRIQMQQMGMTPPQMGMTPPQMGMAPQQMSMAPQQMGMAPQQMGMAPQLFGGSPYVQQAQAIRPTWSPYGPQAQAARPAWSPYGPQAQAARPAWSPYGPQAQAPRQPWSPYGPGVQVPTTAWSPYGTMVSQPMNDLLSKPYKPMTPAKKAPKPKLDLSLDSKVVITKEAAQASLDKTPLTPEVQQGLFTPQELAAGLPMEKMTEIGHIRVTARKEGIDLRAPVAADLIPDWAKGKDVPAADREMGLLVAHRLAKQATKAPVQKEAPKPPTTTEAKPVEEVKEANAPTEKPKEEAHDLPTEEELKKAAEAKKAKEAKQKQQSASEQEGLQQQPTEVKPSTPTQGPQPVEQNPQLPKQPQEKVQQEEITAAEPTVAKPKAPSPEELTKQREKLKKVPETKTRQRSTVDSAHPPKPKSVEEMKKLRKEEKKQKQQQATAGGPAKK